MTNREQHDFIIERATAGDAAFLANATIKAERAHTGKGVWDVILGYDGIIGDSAVACLEEIIRECEGAHIFYKHFLVTRNAEGNAVASCEAYVYPDYTVKKTFDLMMPIVGKHLGWSNETFQERTMRLDFLSSAFPEDVIYNGSWFIETVFTDPEYRGRGISSRLISCCIEEGKSRGLPRSLLLVAEGNISALSVYSKLGYRFIGEAFNEKYAIPTLGCKGFVIMQLDL